MAKASLTIAIGGTYDGKAIDKAEKALRDLNVEAARHAGGISESLARAGDSAVKLGANMQQTGDRIAGMGSAITKATAPIAAVGAASVKLASDYEDAVAKVYTIMDKDVMSTEAMARSILDLSTSTGKSATELADATYQALSASVATDKVAGFVEDAVKLAKSGFTETATAVDTLTTVINAYGYKAEDAQMISDRLVQTQNKGKTTVDELAQSMGNVIPTAAAYNVNLDNLCSSYVILTKQGINTANATTAINGMLTELADEGSDVAEVLRNKTGKSFGQLMAEGKSLGDVIEILNASVDGNSEAFANLWGNVRASKGALAIANAGTAEFASTMGDMADSAGLCDKALDDLATPAAKANKAINAVKNTGIQLGEEIVGAAVPSLEKLASMAQDLYKWFGELDDGTKQSIVQFGALAVAAGPVVTIFGKMYSGVGQLFARLGTGMQNLGAFGAAMKTAEAEMRAAGATSVGLGSKMKAAAEQTGLMTKATNLLKGSLAMIGIGAAVAAVGLIIDKYREWREHTETVDKATRGIEEAVGKAKLAYDSYAPAVEGATRALEDNGVTAEKALESQAQLADRMSETWGEIGTNAAMVDRYASEIDRLGKLNRLTSDEQARLNVAVEGFNQLTGSNIEILDAEHGRLSTTREAILGVAEAYKEEAKAAAAKEMLIEINKQQYQDELALKQAKDELARAEEEYQYQLANFPDSAYAYGQAVVDAGRKVDEMQRALDSAKRSEQDLLDILAQSPAHFKTMEDALDSCGLKIGDLGNVTDEQLEAMRQNFDGTLQSIYDTCVARGMEIPEGLAKGVGEGSDKATKSAEELANAVINQVKSVFEISSPSRVMQRLGAEVDEGLGGGIDGSASRPTGAMSSLGRAIRDAVSCLPDDARRTGEGAGESLARGIEGTSRSAYTSSQGVAGSARDGFGSVDAYNTGWNLAVGFANGMAGPDIWTTAWNVGCSALDAICSALGISSPSKKAMEVGRYFGEGAVIGMRSTEDAIADESQRMSDLMGLSPEPFGGAARAGAASYGAPNMAASNVTMNVTVNVSARDASEGRAAGTSLADALYEELSRKMGSGLWPVSYSTA